MFIKWTFKTAAAILIRSNTFNIVMAVFDVAQHVINQSSGIITGSMNAEFVLDTLQATLEAMKRWNDAGLYLESSMLRLAMQAMSLCVFIIVYGRMIETYLTVRVAPIPFGTMANRVRYAVKG